MKKISFQIFLMFTTLTSYSQGVTFITGGNLRTIFELAKAQNKAVFLEAYAPTCHVCAAFKPTFEKKEVGDYYNRTFVSYQLDLTSPEAAAFLNKQKIWIPSTPTLLYFDKDVKLLHFAIMGENTNSSQVVIQAGQKAFDSKNRVIAYKASYLSGNRDTNFLYEYAFFSRILKDTTANIEAARAYAKATPAKNYSNNTNFLILQKVIIDDENPIAQYLFSHLAEFNGKYDKTLVKQTAENIIMYSLISPKGDKYSIKKINEVRANLTKLGVDKKSIDARVFRQEATAFFKENQPEKGIKVLEALIDKNTPKESYKFLSDFVKARTKDKVSLDKATVWGKLGK
jgi:thiol-disulfide isomerase/thioredoxin